MASDDLFSREEILAGLVAKRASTLVFLIETQTAKLVAQSRRAMQTFTPEMVAAERDMAFLESFSLARRPSRPPTIQDLEQFASHWAVLVPGAPRLKAAIAHILGEKYAFTARAVPNIRATLELDTEAVQGAYKHLYHAELQTIYQAKAALYTRLRWLPVAFAKWLDNLPPFWTAFALTLTETVGAGILALPIALADIGPAAGLVLLVVLGLVNMLTVALIAESVSRSGAIRYNSGFIGRVVNDYLGRAGSLILSLSLAMTCVFGLLPYYIGFGGTLEDVTRIPTEIWIVLLFMVQLYFLRRETLDATVSSALVVGAVNIVLILILSALALTHLEPENLKHTSIPALGGSFDPSILRLIFGVILTAFFGHLSVSNCAHVVLRRDPSTRSLIRGSAAGIGVAIVLYSLWVVGVNGAVPHDVLAAETGTVLVPLAAEVGPIVHILGTVFVILSMGMISIHLSLGLYNLVCERLPGQAQPITVLPRRRGRLLFHKRGASEKDLHIGLTYLGLEGARPVFRADVQLKGRIYRAEHVFDGSSWEPVTSFPELPHLPALGAQLEVSVLEADQNSARVQATSQMVVSYEGEWDTTGVHAADLVTMPDNLRRLLNWVVRQQEVGVADVAAQLGVEVDAARLVMDELLEMGLVRAKQTEQGDARYLPSFAPKRQHTSVTGLLQTVEGYEEQPARPERKQTRFQGALLNPRVRFLLSISPVIGIFLLTEWMVLTEAESFTEPLSFLGVIVLSLFSGIFPVLLLISSRRKGDIVPGRVYKFLGNPVMLGFVYLLSLSSLFVHGLVIWQGSAQGVVALATGVFVVGFTLWAVRSGAFASRTVVSLYEDVSAEPQAAAAGFSVTINNTPAPAAVTLGYRDGDQTCEAAEGAISDFGALLRVDFDLPRAPAKELKVWAHRVTSEGFSEGLPAILESAIGDETARFDLGLSGGQVVLPLDGEAAHLGMTLVEQSE